MAEETSSEIIKSDASRSALGSPPLFRPGMPSSSRPLRFDAKEIDPLLATLSPDAILDAFRAKDASFAESGSLQQVLAEVIAQASAAEQALGARAALAGKKVEEWYTEIERWVWPTEAFEEPSRRPGHGDDGQHAGPVRATVVERPWPVSEAIDEVYWGSLPRAIVQTMAHRVDAIRGAMDELDLEELKDHIRGAHLPSSPRARMTPGSMEDAPNLIPSHLDDWTVILTATIMRTLPFVTRLHRLLDTWSVRLTVLRMVPGFLNLLRETEAAISSAWKILLASETEIHGSGLSLNRETFTTMKVFLSDQLSDLGQALDAMLDSLEGHDDHLPDHWIDRMEWAQAEYESWVAEAERLVGRNEMRAREPVQDAIQPESGSDEATHTTAQEDHTARSNSSNASARNAAPATIAHSPFPGQRERNGTFPSTQIKREDCEVESTPAQASLGLEEAATSSSGEHRSEAAESHASTTTHDTADRIPSHSTLETEDWKALSKVDTLRPQALGEVLHLSEPADQTRPTDMQGNVPVVVEASSKRTPELETVGRPDLASPKTMETSTPNSHFPYEPVSLSRISTMRPAPLDLGKVHDHHAHADLSHPSSSTSETFSEMSSPEIMDASQVQFFKTPTEDKPVFWVIDEPLPISDTVSRNSSQRTQRSPRNPRYHTEPSELIRAMHSRSRSSTMTSIHQPMDISEASSEDDLKVHRYAPIKRASVTSIETIPRSELRSIEVKRTGSYSSTRSAQSLEGVTRDRAVSSTGSQGSKRLQESPLKSMADWDEESARSMAGRRDELTLPALVVSKHLAPSDGGASEHAFPPFPAEQGFPPPIDSAIDVANGTILPSIEYDDDLTTHAEKVSRLPKRPTHPPLSIDDQLTARISSILTRIPASIRLAHGPEPHAPEIRVPSRSSTPQPGASRSVTPGTRPARARSYTPALTLAPAYGKTSSKPRSTVDSEIKLYHLHQPGRDQPIKLYVRLVGEAGERVMVRVGGGWADLGEYLKEYAAHHGQRSASDGHFEIKGLPSTSPGPSAGLPASNGRSSSYSIPMSGQSTPTPATHSRAGSAELRSLVVPKTRRSQAADVPLSASPDAGTSLLDPSPSPTVGGSRRSSVGPPSGQRSMSGTPGPEDDGPLGLAGPRRAKKEIGPRKQAWVDGMMDQARRASGGGGRVTPDGKKKDGGGGGGLIGEIGRVGNVRRVFMKGWSRDEGS